MDMKRIIGLIIVLVSVDNALATDYKCNTASSCGCSSSTTTTVMSKIVGGEAAPANVWRWMVSLQRSTTHMCGASLLSATSAITASHCIADYITKPSTLRIVVGINNLNDQTSTRQIRSVNKIIKHPNYQNETELNDIAIIQFTSLDVTSNSKLAFICLPSAGKDPFKTNTNLVAIGWGVLKESSNYVSNSLQQVTVKAYSDSSSECIKADKTNSTTQFCAGVSGGGKGKSPSSFIRIEFFFNQNKITNCRYMPR